MSDHRQCASEAAGGTQNSKMWVIPANIRLYNLAWLKSYFIPFKHVF